MAWKFNYNSFFWLAIFSLDSLISLILVSIDDYDDVVLCCRIHLSMTLYIFFCGMKWDFYAVSLCFYISITHKNAVKFGIENVTGMEARSFALVTWMNTALVGKQITAVQNEHNSLQFNEQRRKCFCRLTYLPLFDFIEKYKIYFEHHFRTESIQNERSSTSRFIRFIFPLMNVNTKTNGI